MAAHTRPTRWPRRPDGSRTCHDAPDTQPISSEPAASMPKIAISLAHFCELHGPTSILCTQLSSLQCTDGTTTLPATPHSEYLSKSASSSKGYDSSGSSLGDKQQNLNSPFETPPTSPRSANGSHNPYFPRLPVDKAGRRQYSSGSDTEYEDGCDNCSILVPKSMSDRLPRGAPGSPRQDGRGRHGSPILRTQQKVATVQGSPFCSECPDDADLRCVHNGLNESRQAVRRTYAAPKQTISPPSEASGSSHGSYKHAQHLSAPGSAVSSPLSEQPPSLSTTHKHTLTYVSTRQPASPHSYSLLRRSCIRTLSIESLPRGSRNGPLYFGDPVTGYTIAYIFRLRDPSSRGRQRQYALIALGGRDSWAVSRRYVEIIRHFEGIASWVANLADAVLERESNGSTASDSRPGSSASAIAPSYGSPSTPGISGPPTATTSPVKDRERSDNKSITSSTATVSSRTFTPVSSFLSAKKLDPDGYPRGTREAMKPKGLAEIVGRDDFFVELHARFTIILSGLVGAV